MAERGGFGGLARFSIDRDFMLPVSRAHSPNLDLIFAASCCGRSIRFATAMTNSCESRIAGQLKKLYTTSCLAVKSWSSSSMSTTL